MPIYEYKCDDCKARFELLVSGDEDVSCLGCGGNNLTKQVSQISGHGDGGCSSCSSCPGCQ